MPTNNLSQSAPIVIKNISKSGFAYALKDQPVFYRGHSYQYINKYDILLRNDWVEIYSLVPYEEILKAVEKGISKKDILFLACYPEADYDSILQLRNDRREESHTTKSKSFSDYREDNEFNKFKSHFKK